MPDYLKYCRLLGELSLSLLSFHYAYIYAVAENIHLKEKYLKLEIKKEKLVKPLFVDTPESMVIGIKDEKRYFKAITTDDI